jgi:ribosome-associated protein YbcJ (S4-like RNA binding protein)
MNGLAQLRHLLLDLLILLHQILRMLGVIDSPREPQLRASNNANFSVRYNGNNELHRSKTLENLLRVAFPGRSLHIVQALDLFCSVYPTLRNFKIMIDNAQVEVNTTSSNLWQAVRTT